MSDIMTPREIVARARSEGLPISEYTLRRWLKAGVIPMRHAGKKQLVPYSEVVRYLRCEDGGDVQPQQPTHTTSDIKPLPARRGYYG